MFDVLMYYFGANIKITGIFQRFQTEVHALRVIETKVTTRNDLNRDHFGVKGNYESDNNEKTLLWVFLQISDPCFLTLRPPKMQIYLSRTLTGFCNF